MYFDHCDSPQELAEAISDFLRAETGRRTQIHFGPGHPQSVCVALVDRHTDETLRQAYSEARSVAKRLCKQNPGITPPPGNVEILPLQGLFSIGDWGRSITPQEEAGQGDTERERVGRQDLTLLDEFEQNAEVVIELLESGLNTVAKWREDLKKPVTGFIVKRTIDDVIRILESFSRFADERPEILRFLTRYIPEYKSKVEDGFPKITDKIQEIVHKYGQEPSAVLTDQAKSWVGDLYLDMCKLGRYVENLRDDLRFCVRTAKEERQTLKGPAAPPSGAAKGEPPGNAGQGKTKQAIPETEYSLPLSMKKWSSILGFSENKMKEIREAGDKYHFDKVSDRKWRLPKSELPAEYLEKYRSITKSKPQ